MHPYKSLGATVDPPRARSRKKALPMLSPADRNLTALPTKTVKPTRASPARPLYSFMSTRGLRTPA